MCMWATCRYTIMYLGFHIEREPRDREGGHAGGGIEEQHGSQVGPWVPYVSLDLILEDDPGALRVSGRAPAYLCSSWCLPISLSLVTLASLCS